MRCKKAQADHKHHSGETLDTMQDFLSKTGTKQTFVCENLEGALKWTEYLVKNVNFEKVDNAPMQWIKDMLNPKPAARPTALDLSEQIKQTAEGAFMNKCCRFDGSTDSETDLSNDSENDEDVTIVAPVSIPPSEAKLRDKSLNHPRKSVVGEDPLHDTSYFRPAPIHRAVMSMSRVFSYVPKFSFPSFYLKPNTTLDQIPPPVLPDPLQWEFPPPSDQYSYALPGSFPGYDDTSQPVAYSRPMPYPSISEQVQDDYDPAAHNISILAAKAAMQNAARRDEVSEVNSPPRPAEVLPDRFEPTTEERQPYVAASLTYKTDVGYVTENTSMPPQETPSEVPQNRPSSPITYLEPALADFEVPEAPLHFEEYLFNPGAKGFIVYILGSSDRSFQTLKDLLLYPSTKLRHSRSDDNLEIQRRTILILKSTEFLEDDTAVFLRRRSSIAGSRLPEELSEYTRSETFDKLKWAKMSLDKSALFSSPRSSKGIYEQTPEVPNAPATTGDLTNKFFQNLSQLYDGEALLDPNKPSKHDRRPPSPQAPVTPRPSTRANPLVSWLANARSPLGPSRQSPGPKLTGENLGAHNRQVPPVRRSPLPFKLETASNFMKEVYNDAASSVPTSVMSTKTRERFKLAGLFLPSQDRTLNYLGEYTKLGKADAVRLLLKQGCNPGTKTSPRNGPIFNVVRGASSRHTKCLRALIKHGVNVNIRSSRNGKTPLLEAIESEPWSGYVNVIYLLLAAGANPNAKDSSGDSPLLKLLGSGLTPLSEHHRKALALLLSTSYKTNVAVTPLGTRNKPLHLAIRRRDPWAVGMLLERNASLIEAENSEGLTPLSLAVTSWSDNTMSKAQLEILDLLLEKGANVNVRIMLTRKTPLHVAVLHGLVDAVERLLGYGADTTLTTGCGETMMELLGDRKKQHGCDHTCDDCRTIEVLLATVN
jgi:ankyrin repeat protein